LRHALYYARCARCALPLLIAIFSSFGRYHFQARRFLRALL